MHDLTRDEVERYSRQLLLPGFDGMGEALATARVLIVGLGGLGAPLAGYLAGAGVGQLTLCDSDTVSLSNLPRQPLYTTPDVGRAKSEAAAARLQAANPSVRLHTAPALNTQNAARLIAAHDLVVDASDTFTARYLVSDVCAALGRSWVWGAASTFEGMLSVFGEGYTLRDVFPEPGPALEGANCDAQGVLGPLVGVVGSAMAVEALKLLGGVGEPLRGRLWTYDAWSGSTRVIRLA